MGKLGDLSAKLLTEVGQGHLDIVRDVVSELARVANRSSGDPMGKPKGHDKSELPRASNGAPTPPA